MKTEQTSWFSAIGRGWRAIFPTPRRPVTLGTLLPLVVFGVVYGSLVLTAELRNWIHFTNRAAFFLCFLFLWIWWLYVAGRGGLERWRALAALLSRLVLAGLFIALLAEPRAVRKSDGLALVYALDVSDSMTRSTREKAVQWINGSAAKKSEKDEAGLVVFGREAAVEVPPRATFEVEPFTTVIPKDGTDLARGLRIAAAVLPEDKAGRIVLVSDGNQTEGDIGAALDELEALKVPVDVLPVAFDFKHEVWLERMDLPMVVKKGETYEATVLLSALTDGRGILRLTENGDTVQEKEVKYVGGKNRFSFSLPGRGPGYYEYVATILPAEGADSFAGNNVAMANLYLKGERQILVVIDGQGDTREWEGLVEALKASERNVLVQMSHQVPRDALSLLPYDLIILANTSADGFDAVQMQAMHDAVYNLGAGLLMVGSKQTFGPGGYHRTAIEQALPVTMDVSHKKVLPMAALAIVLDRSGSMAAPAGGTTKLGLASRGALGAMTVLNPKDYFTLIAVDTQPATIVPMAQQEERESMREKVLGLSPGGGGIYVFTSLVAAGHALTKVDAGIKHIILFADAADAEEQEGTTAAGRATALDMAGSMNASKISTSVVALGTEADKDTAFLRALASYGGGRFFITDDPTALPKIFFREALTMKRTMLQEKTFTPTVGFPSPILKGIEALPPLHGYVLTTPKPTASILLEAPPDAEELAKGEKPDPVLATWRYGLGTGAAWTSDFAALWARDWMGWESYRPFLKQLVTEVSRAESSGKLAMTASAVGARGIITVEDFAPETRFLEVQARAIGPNREAIDVPLKPIGARRYQGQFPIGSRGYYQVTAVGIGGTGTDGKPVMEQALGGFAVPYSPEHLKFKSDSTMLANIARRTGGRILSPDDPDLFKIPSQVREKSNPIFDWFLIVLACLIPLDVALRRVHLDWTAIFGWFRRKDAKASTTTMGALLQRKQRTQETRPMGEVKPALMKVERPARPADVPPPKDATSPPLAEEPESTTGRLLARKRQREQKKEE